MNLPGRMTLEKFPDLSWQIGLLGFEPKVSIEEGIERVLAKVKSRVGGEGESHTIY